jgi:hypothetical protein
MRLTIQTRHRRLLIATGDDAEESANGLVVNLASADLTIADLAEDESGYEPDESRFGFTA